MVAEAHSQEMKEEAMLCQALQVDRSDDGSDLVTSDAITIRALDLQEPPGVVLSKRIGLSKAADLPYRYCAAGHPFLSRPVIH